MITVRTLRSKTRSNYSHNSVTYCVGSSTGSYTVLGSTIQGAAKAFLEQHQKLIYIGFQGGSNWVALVHVLPPPPLPPSLPPPSPGVFFFGRTFDFNFLQHFRLKVKSSHVQHMMFKFALAGKQQLYWQPLRIRLTRIGMAKEPLYCIDCPYTDCSECHSVLVHEEAVSRLKGLDRSSHKKWLDDEVHYEAKCKIHFIQWSYTGCQWYSGKDGVWFKEGRKTLCKGTIVASWHQYTM